MNTEANTDLLNEIQPDDIIVAAGSIPRVLNVPGVQYAYHATAAYYQPEKMGNTIVLIGGGLIGCEVALHLAAQGKSVTILEVTDTLARDANMFHRPTMMEHMEVEKEKIHYVLNASTKVIGRDGVLFIDADGNEQFIHADTVLYAVGSVANTEVVEEIRNWGEWDTFMPIGDCTGASIIRKAVHGGYFAAMDIGC